MPIRQASTAFTPLQACCRQFSDAVMTVAPKGPMKKCGKLALF
jgi:hypothetical protein